MTRARENVWLLAASAALFACSTGTATMCTTGCTTTSGSTSAGGGITKGAQCLTCGDPVTVATLQGKGWKELSGIAASVDHPGSFYTHNDSGDTARFFATDMTGADKGTFNVTGASATDWEDIARGPCADATLSCVYLADIGDNNAVRKSYTVYRVREPSDLSAGEHAVDAETFPFVYPDGAHNAETLLVHPKTGEMYVVTKSAVGSTLYQFPMPLKAGVSVTLEKKSDVFLPGILELVTGGDIRPDGAFVALRTYGHVWGYPIGAGETLDAALAKKPCEWPSAAEEQGEALGFLIDGSGYVMTSEGDNPPLDRVDCKP